MTTPTYADVTVRVDVSDVTPEMVRAYLEARGWREHGAAGWLPPEPRPITHVRIEGTPRAAGWAIRAAALVEDRSPLAVLADIRAVWARALLAERGVDHCPPDACVRIDALDSGGVGVYVSRRKRAGAVWSTPVADCEWLAESRNGLSPTEAVGPWVDWTAWADAVAEAWRTVAGYPACR